MKLKWYGHASFRITSDDGTSTVTDPYPPQEAGYKPVDEAADIVVISSDTDSFHCRADLIPGSPAVINALELARSGQTRSEKGIPFWAIEAMENVAHRDYNPDQNAMYRFAVDGIEIGHMGDVGNALSQAQLDFFQGVDVLLALTGGYPTIALDDLKTVIDAVQPRLVVPMHFQTLRYKPRNALWIPSFLEYFDDEDVTFACASEAPLNRADLPQSTQVLVLDYA